MDDVRQTSENVPEQGSGTIDDYLLIHRTLNGDRRALEALVRNHYQDIYRCFLKQLIVTIGMEYDELKISSDFFDHNVLYGEGHEPIPHGLQTKADDRILI